MAQDDELQDVAALWAPNRVYMNRLGLLNPHLDGSPFTLSKTRILYEIAHRSAPTAAAIGRALHLDRGRISRTLKRCSDQGLRARGQRSPNCGCSMSSPMRMAPV